MATVTVGRLIAAHGVSGACRCEYRTDFPERIPARERYLLRDPASGEVMFLTTADVNLLQDCFIISFAEKLQREELAAHRGWLLEVPRESLPDTGGGEDGYYYFELEGLRVLNADGGEAGRVVNVIPGTAHELLEVEDAGGSRTLIAFVHSAIAEVDLAAGIIRLHPPGRDSGAV